MTDTSFCNIYEAFIFGEDLQCYHRRNLEEGSVERHRISNPPDRSLQNKTNWINPTARWLAITSLIAFKNYTGKGKITRICWQAICRQAVILTRFFMIFFSQPLPTPLAAIGILAQRVATTKCAIWVRYFWPSALHGQMYTPSAQFSRHAHAKENSWDAWEDEFAIDSCYHSCCKRDSECSSFYRTVLCYLFSQTVNASFVLFSVLHLTLPFML